MPQESVHIFLEKSSKQLANLPRVAGANVELLDRTAHSMKGELIYLDMPSHLAESRRIEETSHDRDLKYASEVFAVFEAGVSAAAADLNGMLGVNHETVNR